MTTVSVELVQACRNCVEAFAADSSPDSAAAGPSPDVLVAAADLLRHPVSDAVRWLGGAVLMLARDLGPSDLDELTSCRMPEPGAVRRTVTALREEHATFEEAAERDPVELVLRLAATAAALLQ